MHLTTYSKSILQSNKKNLPIISYSARIKFHPRTGRNSIKNNFSRFALQQHFFNNFRWIFLSRDTDRNHPHALVVYGITNTQLEIK